MNTVIKHCDYCEKIVSIDKKRVETVHGFCLELGYSIGGWGSRKDFIPKQAVEICDDCYSKVSASIIALNDTINACKTFRPIERNTINS